MAQTWPVSRKRIAVLRFVDLIGRAATSLFPRQRRKPDPPIERILVIEPWNIGDVVLATPVLAELRNRFPASMITLLARVYARELLEGSGLVDEVIVADLPWTAQTRKYRITPGVAKDLRNLVRGLRQKRFDVTIDSRMDIRSNILAAATGAPRRIGYSIGGGGWLLTDTLPSDREAFHKIDDWLELLQLMPNPNAPEPIERAPRLTVADHERVIARKTLAAKAGDERPTIGYHPGGSHPGKRWPEDQFRALITELRTAIGGRHIVFLGPDEAQFDRWPDGVAVMRPTLRELMAQISSCDILICNDSGPMHIADALGVPVVTIFEIGNPQWFGPSGPRSRVVRGESAGTGLSAAPLDRPPRNPVTVTRVAEAVKDALGS